MTDLERIQKNREGLNRGYAWCRLCFDSWFWKNNAAMTIWYQENSAMNPICSECFDKASFEQIMESCETLWRFWASIHEKVKLEDFPAEFIARSVAKLKKERSG